MLYFFACMCAGFVTPGLNQWILSIAPQESRGNFFAKKNILNSIVNASVMFLMGRQLDYFIGQGQPQTGYFIVYGTILLLTFLDIALLSHVWETPSQKVLNIRPQDFLRPFRDRKFRSVILFDTLWFIAGNFSSVFLPVYLLRGLGLSHSYISVMTILASVTGIFCNWVWGRMADRRGWRSVLTAASALSCCGYMGWFLITPTAALFAAPVLQCIATAGSSASSLATLNMEYASCPEEGKTVYLGAVAVVSNLMGYMATLAASGIQSTLEHSLGTERSVSRAVCHQRRRDAGVPVARTEKSAQNLSLTRPNASLRLSNGFDKTGKEIAMQKTIVPCAAFDRAAAQKVLRQVLQKPDSTLCLATGDTTAGIFTRMVELKQALDLDCARVKCINMDEYVGVRREEPASCYFRIVRDLYAPLGLREDQFYVPVAPTSQAQQERERFARKLRGFGGIDFMLLSVGGNGHIAFNEPGADFGAHIHVANLTQSTLQAKAELFGGADKVPAQGLTLGIADVMAARHILLVANGVHKAEIIRRALEGPITPEVPASVLQPHPNLDILLDEAAAQ